MKKSFITLIFMFGILFGTLVALQQSWAQEHIDTVPGFELIGTREVNEVMGSNIIPGGISGWQMTEPSKARGLIVSIKVTFPPGVTDLESSALILSYSTNAGAQRAICLGVTLQGLSEKGGKWFLAVPEKGSSLSLAAQGNTLESSFFFAVPPTISEASLVYKNKAVLKIINLTWK